MARFADFPMRFPFKIIIIFLVLGLSGCTTIEIPSYVKDQHPYKRKVYVSFDDTLKATQHVLEESAWVIKTQAKPSVYEMTYAHDEDSEVKQVMLITDIKQGSFILGTAYTRLNIFIVSSQANETDIELRYLTIKSFPLKSFTSYRKDHAANQILDKIEKALSK